MCYLEDGSFLASWKSCPRIGRISPYQRLKIRVCVPHDDTAALRAASTPRGAAERDYTTSSIFGRINRRRRSCRGLIRALRTLNLNTDLDLRFLAKRRCELTAVRRPYHARPIPSNTFTLSASAAGRQRVKTSALNLHPFSVKADHGETTRSLDRAFFVRAPPLVAEFLPSKRSLSRWTHQRRGPGRRRSSHNDSDFAAVREALLDEGVFEPKIEPMRNRGPSQARYPHTGDFSCIHPGSSDVSSRRFLHL